MAADLTPDAYQVIGSPPSPYDTISTSPIGPAYSPGTVVHFPIGAGVPAVVTVVAVTARSSKAVPK